MELTSRQRVARLRAQHARERWENSTLCKLGKAAGEIDDSMTKYFPRRWEDFKMLLALGGVFTAIQVMGYIHLFATGQPLDFDF